MRIRFKATSAQRAMRWVQYVLVAFGAGALSYCLFVLTSAWLYQKHQARSFDRTRESRQVKGSDREASVVPGEVLGRLRIPRLGVSTMVVEGVDERDLRRAVGHIPGTALLGESGNVAIAGHRDGYFRPLQKIHSKDRIQLITLRGTYNYKVVSTRVVNPDDVAVLNPTKRDTLTLVTCYPFHFIGAAPKRFIVRATRGVSN